MIHVGRYTFNEDAIDVIVLQGNGDYLVYLARTGQPDREPILVADDDADALREYLDREKMAERVGIEMEELEQKARRTRLQYDLKHPDI